MMPSDLRTSPFCLALLIVTIQAGNVGLFAQEIPDQNQNIPSINTPKQNAASREIDKLIEQLGDDSYAVREAATQKLSECGSEILVPLLVAINHPDLEVETRARAIVRSLCAADETWKKILSISRHPSPEIRLSAESLLLSEKPLAHRIPVLRFRTFLKYRNALKRTQKLHANGQYAEALKLAHQTLRIESNYRLNGDAPGLALAWTTLLKVRTDAIQPAEYIADRDPGLSAMNFHSKRVLNNLDFSQAAEWRSTLQKSLSSTNNKKWIAIRKLIRLHGELAEKLERLSRSFEGKATQSTRQLTNQIREQDHELHLFDGRDSAAVGLLILAQTSNGVRLKNIAWPLQASDETNHKRIGAALLAYARHELARTRMTTATLAALQANDMALDYAPHQDRPEYVMKDVKRLLAKQED